MSANVMVIFTLVMIGWLIVNKFIQTMIIETNKLEVGGKTKEELSGNIIVIGCIGVPSLFGYTIAKLVYYLYFLEHDILKYPTYLMLFLFGWGITGVLYRVIKKCITKKENEPFTKFTVKSILMTALVLVFYIYALVVLILW